jgi:hypothetical protein
MKKYDNEGKEAIESLSNLFFMIDKPQYTQTIVMCKVCNNDNFMNKDKYFVDNENKKIHLHTMLCHDCARGNIWGKYSMYKHTKKD